MTKCSAITTVAMLALGAAAGMVQAQPLYFTATASNQIWVASMDGSGTPSVLYANAGPFPQGPVGIDLDKSTGKLFWGTGNNSELWTADADGSGTPSSVYTFSGFTEQHDAEVDEANARVFFTAFQQGVYVGPTDGSGPVTQVYAGNPSTVAYDPANDLIYFGGPFGSISVGAADGSSQTPLYAATNVRDIAIDPAGGTIYWVDLNSIWAAPIDGSGTPTVLFPDNGGNLRAIEIDVATGTLFLGEFNTPAGDMIWTANADGSGTPTTLYAGAFGGIRGLTLTEAPLAVPGVSAVSMTVMALLLLAALTILLARRRRAA